MKKLANIIAAALLCSALALMVGCSSNEGEITADTDPANEVVIEGLSLQPVGVYHFDSIAVEASNGDITAAGLDAEWEGTILTPDYATAEIKDDGTVVFSGALNLTANWYMTEDGCFDITLDLPEGQTQYGYSIDSEGYFGVDIYKEDGSVYYYMFLK